MKERNTTLDLAKGILIILVVLGHAIIHRKLIYRTYL